jgi:hypothetical protein
MSQPQTQPKSSAAVNMAVSLILALSKPAMGESPDKADPRHHAPVTALVEEPDYSWQGLGTPEDPFHAVIAQLNAGSYPAGNLYH